MLVLFDHGTPKGLSQALAGHVVKTAQQHGWDRLRNGELLTEAERAGFEVLVTTDKSIRYQQNLANRRIAIVVIGNSLWPLLRLHTRLVCSAVDTAAPGSYAEVHIPG